MPFRVTDFNHERDCFDDVPGETRTNLIGYIESPNPQGLMWHAGQRFYLYTEDELDQACQEAYREGYYDAGDEIMGEDL